MDNAEIGIIGGSGFYSMISNPKSVEVTTEYGKPSDSISIGEIGGRKVAFLPRHGSKHTIPPAQVPYRANIKALQQLGVTQIIATAAMGSLNPEYGIGTIALLDQFLNFTNGREDTFYDKNIVAHVSSAEPYCSRLRKSAINSASDAQLNYKSTASVVVINGPRFSSKAESRFFSRQGLDLINMTQYPEVILARELGLCYLGIGIVTDYDAGVIMEAKPVNNSDVIREFGKNVEIVKPFITDIISKLPKERVCECANAMDGAIMTK